MKTRRDTIDASSDAVVEHRRWLLQHQVTLLCCTVVRVCSVERCAQARLAEQATGAKKDRAETATAERDPEAEVCERSL